MHSRFGMNFL
jgi:hypothetical protein